MLVALPYPIFVDLADRAVLIVGAGAVALRKTQGLLDCRARVTVVSPEFAPGFDKIVGIDRIVASYAATHMARKMWRLVFAATNVREVNERVYKHASAAGILCCRSDDPDEGDFSSGASQRIGTTRKTDHRGRITETGGLILAVSTAGASPPLAARICREAAAGIDPVLPLQADLLAEWRTISKAQLTDIRERRALLKRLAGEEMESIIRRQGPAAAQKLFLDWLDEVLKKEVSEAGKDKPIRAVSGKSHKSPQTIKYAD